MTSGLEFKQQEIQSNREFKIDALEGNLGDVLDSFDFETKKQILIVYVRKSHIYTLDNKMIDLKILNQPMVVHVINKYFAFTGAIELSKELHALKKYSIESAEYPCLLFLAYDAKDQLGLIDFVSLKSSNFDKLAPKMEKRLRQIFLNHLNTTAKEDDSTAEQRKERLLPQIPPQLGGALKTSDNEKVRILPRKDSKPQTAKELSDLSKNKPQSFHDEKQSMPTKKPSFDYVPKQLPKMESLVKEIGRFKNPLTGNLQPKPSSDQMAKNGNPPLNREGLESKLKKEQLSSNAVILEPDSMARPNSKTVATLEEQRRLDQERRYAKKASRGTRRGLQADDREEED